MIFSLSRCCFIRKEVEGLIAVEMPLPVRWAAWAIVVTSSFSKGGIVKPSWPRSGEI